MVVAVFAALLVQSPQIAVGVDRDTVRAGEDIIITITVQAPGDMPIEIVDPELTGLDLRNTSNQSRYVVAGNLGSRTTTRTLTVRATKEGEATIGPVVVRQGGEEVSTPSITIVVRGALPAGVRALDPRIVSLLSTMEPAIPSGEEVALTVSAVPGEVTLGEQVDVIIAAWVPRGIRSRLRNPPTLEAPQVRGAWAYQRPTPPGIALTREVGGITYDVFVQHEVIFPLTAGSATIGSAKVSYSLPLSYSFLSREMRHEVRSEPVKVVVTPYPGPPEGTVFGGATGSDLIFEVTTPPRELAIGNAARVTATVRGDGNVALWPEPDLRWPPGLRAYPQGVDVRLREAGGVVGGEKAFNYLVIADSVGAHQVGVLPYLYYDVGAGEYRTLTSPAIEFVTPGGRLVMANRGEGLPPLLPLPSMPRADMVAISFSRGMLLFVLLGPPLLAAALGLARRRRRPRRVRVSRPPEDWESLHGLDIAFRRLLESLVPHAAERSGSELADALRAAGIETTLAAHAARLRDRLSSAVYGPDDLTDSDELSLEVQEVIKALTTENRPVERRALAVLTVLVLVLPGGAAGQSAEVLYGAGAARAAADSLSARVDQAPYVAEHWYNLGNALSALGEPVHARAAWIRAARLAPRSDTMRQTLRGSISSGIARRPTRVWVAPFTAVEAYAVALLLWVIGWAVVIARRRARVWWPTLLLAVSVAVIGYAVHVRYAEPLALILRANAGLRAAPYGPAPFTVGVEAGAPVTIEREEGQWVLVRFGRDRGWMRVNELVRI